MGDTEETPDPLTLRGLPTCVGLCTQEAGVGVGGRQKERYTEETPNPFTLRGLLTCVGLHRAGLCAVHCTHTIVLCGSSVPRTRGQRAWNDGLQLGQGVRLGDRQVAGGHGGGGGDGGSRARQDGDGLPEVLLCHVRGVRLLVGGAHHHNHLKLSACVNSVCWGGCWGGVVCACVVFVCVRACVCYL